MSNCTNVDKAFSRCLEAMSDEHIIHYAKQHVSLDSEELLLELARRLEEKTNA